MISAIHGTIYNKFISWLYLHSLIIKYLNKNTTSLIQEDEDNASLEVN